MKKKISHFVVVFLTVIGAYILESSALPSIGGVTGNLMVITVASYGLLLGEREGLAIGFFSGLLCDIFFGPLIGFEALIYAVTGFLCGKFKRILYIDGIGFPLLLIGVSDLAAGFLSYIFLFLIRGRLFLSTFFITVMVPELVYTLLLSVPVYPLIRLLYNKFLKELPSSVILGGDRDGTLGSM